MVLGIQISNFFSIKETVTLDMRASNIRSKNAQELRQNIFSYEKTNVLKTAVIYGANASGKSNIIKAIRFCHNMVLNSHNHNENTNFNYKKFKFKGYDKKPSTYFIRFVAEDIEYEYAFSLMENKILTESLHYYPKGRIKKVFTRDETAGSSKKEKYSFGEDIKRPMDVAENTSEKTLFISRASQMDREIGKRIFNYFTNHFILGYVGLNAPHIENLFIDYKAPLLDSLKVADSDISDIKLRKVKNPGKHFNANLEELTLSAEEIMDENLEIVSYHKSAPKVPFDFFKEESAGTIKLFTNILSILYIVKQNKVLLVDEIGESLHTEIIDYIFNLFKISEKAQLMCTTHNTSFLDLKKFRKDQIWFVNKTGDGASDLYSLYDYGDFRDTMDLEKAYYQGRFEALPFVDDTEENLKEIIHG
ncbi:MAG: AAA family ATPase [Bacteroidota bacterium]